MFDDVYKFGAITYYKVIYIERAFDTWRDFWQWSLFW